MKVLFVCIQNAGRSQMAKAFASELGLEARSAGSAPAQHVHPEVVQVMAELGIDVSGQVPRMLELADVEWADTVITMGCGDACPILPGTSYVDWNLVDPHGLGADGVRVIRDEIRERVLQLIPESES